MRSIHIPALTKEDYGRYMTDVRSNNKRPQYLANYVRTYNEETEKEDWSDCHHIELHYLRPEKQPKEFTGGKLHHIKKEDSITSLVQHLKECDMYEEYSMNWKEIVKATRGISTLHEYTKGKVIIFIREPRAIDGTKCYLELEIRDASKKDECMHVKDGEQFLMELVKKVPSILSYNEDVYVLGK